MKFNRTQQEILDTIHSIIITNKCELHNYDTLFSNDLIEDIKNNFKVNNIGSFDESVKPENIAYIISVLKKTKKYIIKYCDFQNKYDIIIKN